MKGKYTMAEVCAAAETLDEIRRIVEILKECPGMMVKYVCPHCSGYGAKRVRQERKGGPCPVPCMAGLQHWIETEAERTIRRLRRDGRLPEEEDAEEADG